MGIENELSQICAMIESGKLCYADAVYYLNLMRKNMGSGRKSFGRFVMCGARRGTERRTGSAQRQSRR